MDENNELESLRSTLSQPDYIMEPQVASTVKSYIRTGKLSNGCTGVTIPGDKN